MTKPGSTLLHALPPKGENLEWRGPFELGEVLRDTYEVTSILGEGGMGLVYEALDRGLSRVVAVKVPASEAHAHALRREAQTMAAIRHPGLVAVHALDRHRGVEFLVMERLSGRTLKDQLLEAWAAGKPIR